MIVREHISNVAVMIHDDPHHPVSEDDYRYYFHLLLRDMRDDYFLDNLDSWNEADPDTIELTDEERELIAVNQPDDVTARSPTQFVRLNTVHTSGPLAIFNATILPRREEA